MMSSPSPARYLTPARPAKRQVRGSPWHAIPDVPLSLESCTLPPAQPSTVSLIAPLSILVFFALCCQCGATVVTLGREMGSWLWAAFGFAYMTGLAYVGALVTFQIASSFGT